MKRTPLEGRIAARARDLLARVGRRKPALFDPRTWSGRVLTRCMADEDYRGRFFRFIDVLPWLADDAALVRHAREYFPADRLTPAACGALRDNINAMARGLLSGETADETLATLGRLRSDGFGVTLAVVGEHTVSEAEADEYARACEDLLDVMAGWHGHPRRWGDHVQGSLPRGTQEAWSSHTAATDHATPASGSSNKDDAARIPAPALHLSIKPSALYSQVDPADFEGSVEGILARLIPIYRRIVAAGGMLCIDMETRRDKNLTLDLFRRLRSLPEFRGESRLCITLQTYLRETDADLDALLDWSRRRRLPLAVRLVKGAYWEHEVAHARENGRPVPVYLEKAETDAAFERCAAKILTRGRGWHVACASHNVRSAVAVLERAAAARWPHDGLEFQNLYGMAEPIQNALLAASGRVRLYCPHGPHQHGMAYVMRRLIENTSRDSFLRRAFGEKRPAADLAASPEQAVSVTLSRPKGPCEGSRRGRCISADQQQQPQPANGGLREGRNDTVLGVPESFCGPPFRNEPSVDFTLPQVRTAFVRALARVRRSLGRRWPLLIDGRNVRTDDVWNSVNPSRPEEIVGRISQAGPLEVEHAVAAAARAQPAWAATPPTERAAALLRTAAAARGRFFDLAAWQVVETGKAWDEAAADVTEAIDYFEFYAREMLRLTPPQRLGDVPGEVNAYFYRPRGVAAVIAPWNFPLAISAGMTAAALVTGNTVLYKPSEHSPVIGRLLAELYRDAGLPRGVFNFVPGRREVIGDLLVEHPRVALVAFTGSMQVGLRILQRAAVVRPGQTHIKKVIAEMGGKNAIVIDSDADLDVAVPEVVASAFGYQGQKCSACSRVLVHAAVAERFTRRLVEAVRSLKVGPAEDPGARLGPLISDAAQRKFEHYLDLARRDGRFLYSGPVTDDGYAVPATIMTDVPPESALAQEEIFGPLLVVLHVKTFEQGLAWANASRFALTGGVFSRSPANLERARREFLAGNLYLNRRCTGAKVGRQPFGGFRLSGVGSKAGGPDYLLQFMEPVTVTENTVRRGFVPELF